MRWGEWIFDRENLALVHEESGYEIDLERIHSSAAILDWIFQIRQKGWAKPGTIASLLKAFDDILHPQEHFCANEQDLRADGGKLARAFARRMDEPKAAPGSKGFTRWLKAQKKREDGIGDLARDVCQDKDGPGISGTYEDWRRHLLTIGASSEAMEALRRAKVEFDQRN